MDLLSIVVGDYGQVAKITFIDVDTDAAADISNYTTAQQMIFTHPSGISYTKTAAFDSDGTDGIIKYTIDVGLFNKAGWWKVRGRVNRAAATLSTAEHVFEVLN